MTERTEAPTQGEIIVKRMGVRVGWCGVVVGGSVNKLQMVLQNKRGL